MTDKTEIELLAEALVGYRGVNGARVREDDEGYGESGGSSYRAPLNRYVSRDNYNKQMNGQPVKMVAKFPGRCAASGEAIKPGDTVQFNPVTRTRILLQKGGA